MTPWLACGRPWAPPQVRAHCRHVTCTAPFGSMTPSSLDVELANTGKPMQSKGPHLTLQIACPHPQHHQPILPLPCQCWTTCGQQMVSGSSWSVLSQPAVRCFTLPIHSFPLQCLSRTHIPHLLTSLLPHFLTSSLPHFLSSSLNIPHE